MNEKYSIKCLIDGDENKAVLELEEDNDICRILFLLRDYSVTVEAENYFFALLELRKKLEAQNIKILCKGASRNVYPSPMILSMGEAIKAYQLTMGKQARMSDLVNIFAPCEVDEYATIEEQLIFYNDWLRS